MQVKFLKNIVSSIAGNGAIGIVDLLNEKKNVNEFLIAKKLNLTINQTRNILYKLADEGLVSFIRKKDNKKGGWYTYYWSLNTDKSLDLLKKKITEQINEQERILGQRRNERFYYSPDIGLEYTEEQALENNFIDPETGTPLELKNNSELISSLEKDITRTKGVLIEIDQELSLVRAKGEKVKQRKIKAEEVKKLKEREEKRKAKAKEKAKLKGKDSKKIVKKVVKKVIKKKSKVSKNKSKKKKL